MVGRVPLGVLALATVAAGQGIGDFPRAPGCDFGTLADRVDAVNSMCCHGGADCACTLDCAAEFMPLIDSCRPILDVILDGGDGSFDGVAAQLDDLHAGCLEIPEADILAEMKDMQTHGQCTDDVLDDVARTDVADAACTDTRDTCADLMAAGLQCKDATMITDCRATCAACDDHRRAQIRRAQIQGRCPLAAFDADAAAVNAACCDEEGCSGVPDVCDAKCALHFNDFFDRCSGILNLQIPAEDMVKYTQLHTTCSTQLPIDPLLRALLACRQGQHPGSGVGRPVPTFSVSSGSCTTSVNRHCVQSPNYPNNYGNSESCSIDVHGTGVLNTEAFETESGFDRLVIDGHTFTGRGESRGPAGIRISDDSDITWHTDGSVSHGGWEICAASAPPPPPPGARCTGRATGNFLDYNGIRYATLTDGVARDNDDDHGYLGDSTHLPLPGPDWTIAEDTSAVRAHVVSPYQWGTDCVIFSNGESYYTFGNSHPGSGCGSDELRPHDDGTYGLRAGCCRRIMIQCSLSDPEHPPEGGCEVGSAWTGSIRASDASWDACSDHSSHLSFSPGYVQHVAEIDGGCFRSQEFSSLWAPLAGGHCG